MINWRIIRILIHLKVSGKPWIVCIPSKIDNNIVSNNNPFFNLINQYKDRKKIDVKENIHWSKILTDIINGALKGSANENERLANVIYSN